MALYRSTVQYRTVHYSTVLHLVLVLDGAEDGGRQRAGLASPGGAVQQRDGQTESAELQSGHLEI